VHGELDGERASAPPEPDPSTRLFMSSSMRRTSGWLMIATRGAEASFHALMLEPCLRSRAYSSAFKKALDATDTPWMPTRMRAEFIMRNICDMPWLSLASPPTGTPTQRSFWPKFRMQVAEPLMPILCSMPPSATSLLGPSVPSGLTVYLGTTKSVRPLVPAGVAGPSTRARTRWTMFSARSWSPPEMKILVPVMA